ncbi:recombinase RecT [Actinomadura madurae]|uniref:recombinase RecT n=1 Tax=Actinomadura madurae TaxID=1993 RepID=UPI0020D1F784|nr:recombinase RecT [Actinomadura madurae]MCP9963949.1 recombinase RecT [Actinomadura madurae]MCP9976424.1 recombinase RecT [Actinomadura madurae]MCQ0012084.1 recombinase RecT [Actinomadura madurae]MCQ0012616.1 recombinase RecT [Actinomadura madurae]
MTDLQSRVRQRRAQGGGVQDQGQPGTQVSPVDRKMADARQMFTKMQGEFAAALPKHVGIDRFMRMALTCMRKNPQLLDCDPASVLGALLEAARLGLEPGTKQAAIVPFGRQATFIAQWQGLVELMYRSGQVTSVTAEFIHEADEWEYTVGDDGRFYHRPNLLAGDRGPILLAYAFATIKGGGRSRVVFLSKPEAEEIRDEFSKNYQRAEKNRRGNPQQYAEHPDWGKFNSTWHTHFDAMWRKSCVRRLADWVPSSPELRELLMKENEAGEMRDAADQIVPDNVFDGEVVSDTADEPGDGAPTGDMSAADEEAAAQAAAEAGGPDA